MTPDDRVIVIRKPLQPGQYPYIPPKYQLDIVMLRKKQISPEEQQRQDILARYLSEKNKVVFQETMTEEEKMTILAEEGMKQMNNTNKMTQWVTSGTHFAQSHPSELNKGNKELSSVTMPPKANSIPPSHHTCYHCRGKGHWKQDCPLLQDPNYQPEFKHKPAAGIPKSMLKVAETEEEKKVAMTMPDGRLVVMKKSNKYQTNAWKRARELRQLEKEEVETEVVDDV